MKKEERTRHGALESVAAMILRRKRLLKKKTVAKEAAIAYY
jgi:hypothetical protein